MAESREKLNCAPEDLETIIRIQNRVVGAASSFAGAMQEIVNCCCELMPFDGAAIELLRDGKLIYESVAGPLTKDYLGLTLDADASISGFALKTMETLISNDCVNDMRADRAGMIRLGIGSALIVPFIVDGRGFGVLKVVSREKNFFGERYQIMLESIGSFLSMTLNSARERERQARQFEHLSNSLPQLAWMADRDGHIFWYNQRWYDYTGSTPEEMKGWGWEKYHQPHRLEGVRVRWMTALATGSAWEDTFPLVSRLGEWRWFLSRATPVRDSHGTIECWFGTNTDITDNLKNQSDLRESRDIAERANAAKTQFLANMSHEIRTPLGAVMGFSALLRDPQLPQDDRLRYLQIIERNSQNLLRLVDDILDLSKVEAGKITIEQTEFVLREFFSELEAVMTLKAEEKGIRFHLRVDPGCPERIATDSLRLKQILSNIIGNAIKFTDHGLVSMSVTFVNGKLRCEVQDSGIGISAANIGKLFQPFGQIDPSMNRKFGGTGLGLALSKMLAGLLGGDIEFISRESSSGSLFLVTIAPLVLETEPVPVTKSQIPRATDDLTGMRILIVEDSPDSRELLKIYLKKSGATVYDAANGLEGYTRARDLAPDVTLMDVQMPIMNGHEVTEKLRAENFVKPIIALTAHAMREERDRCLQAGCNDFLTKPVRKEDLVALLKTYRPRPSETEAQNPR